MHKRIGLSLLILLSASFALYSSSVPIGVLQGRGDTSMSAALANAGFTNVQVIDLDLLTQDKVDLTKYQVLVYAPDIYLNDADSYNKVAGQFNKVARLLHTGKINILMMGQPYTHVYDFIPFYQNTYGGTSKSTWDMTITDPNHALLKYPNVLTQSDFTTIGTTVNHYIAYNAGNNNMDGRIVAQHASAYPTLAELRWGLGKIVVNTLNNGCVGTACAPQYYKLLQNMVAYLTSVDVSGPLRSGLNGTAITVTTTAGQGATARLVTPTWVTPDATDKPLSGNQATFTIVGNYPGQFMIKAEIYNALGNRTGEGYYRIGFVTTNNAPRIAVLEPMFYSNIEYGLDMAGYAYTIFDESNIGKLNLSNFDLLIYDYDLYTKDPPMHTLVSNLLANVTSWVAGGGKVVMYPSVYVYPQSYAPISVTSVYQDYWWRSDGLCAGWGVTIIDPTHQFLNYPHPFDATNLNYMFVYWCHRMFNGINGIEGEHPFSYDISQNYQFMGIKNYSLGKLVFTTLYPQWLWHSNPGLTEKQHDNQIYYLENMMYALNQNLTGFMKSYYGYMVKAVRCTQPVQNANVSLLLPGTSTVVDSVLTDSRGYGIVNVDFGTYDVRITLPDSTVKVYANQVFN